MSIKKHVSCLFEIRPEQWGLRGDPFLWDEFEQYFSNIHLPISEEKLRQEIEQYIRKLIAKNPHKENVKYIKEYAHGGMSSGCISLSFWFEIAIPLLIERLNQLQKSNGGRGISRRFIDDLKNGELTFFLNEAKSNPGICLEIRRNYINLYYKGGNAIKITEKNRGYSFHFDSKYCLNKDDDQQFQYLSSLDSSDPKQFIVAWPAILSEMDSWFAVHPKPERDFQHNLIKQNQSGPIILDIEYAGWTTDRRLFRLDMLAVTQSPDGYKLIVIENKYSTGAIGGKAGLKKHYDDIVEILAEPASRKELLDSVINIANNKYELGLIQAPISRDAIHSYEILFVFADFNFKSKMIANEVKKISQAVPATVLHMAADEVVINLAEAKDLFAYAD